MTRRSQPCREPDKGNSSGQPEAGINLVRLKNRNKELSASPKLMGTMAGMAN